MSKYPLSFKCVLVVLGIILGMSVFFIPSNGQTYDPNQMAIPDALIPWNDSMENVVTSLDQMYEYAGKPTKWSMCATGTEGLWQMCLRDDNKAAPFTFHFKGDKLSGYTAEFPYSEYGHLIHSAKTIYKGGARGLVKSKNREFRIYEMPIRNGWLELYMVYDKQAARVRLQAKYIYTGKVEDVKEMDVETSIPVMKPMEVKPVEKGLMKDIKAWDGESSMAYVTPILMTGNESLNFLSVEMLKPLSSKSMKGLGAPLRRVTLLALASLLSGIN
jgi:hypothetical protein